MKIDFKPMNKQSWTKKLLPYIVALGCFAALCAAYFAPQFQGKEIVMHDITQYKGMSKEIIDHRDAYDEDPQWTGAMFGGMPSSLITMDHNSVLIQKPYELFGFKPSPAVFIFMAMLSFFIMLRMFGVNPWVGIIPSLAYGLSTYFFIIIGAGHITKMLALAYAPLMVGSLAYTFRSNMWLGAALTALFAALEISAAHPQITYYFIFIMVALWINEGIRAYKEGLLPKFAKATGLLAIAAIMAVGANLSQLWYVNEYGKESMRGGGELVERDSGDKRGSGLTLEYITGWSYGKTESFNMFIPDLMGGTSSGGFSDDAEVAQALAKYNARAMATKLPAYWGDQPMTAGPTYIGAVIIYLCVLGLFLLRSRCKWWVVVPSAVALMLAWGSNFMWFTELFYNFVPGYNKFRTVAMILVVLQWSIPFLAALILHKLWKSEITRAELIRGVKNSLYVTVGVALFFLLFGSVVFNFSAPYDTQMGLPDDVLAAMRGERASMLRMDSLRSMVFVLLTAATVLLFGLGRMKRWMLIVALSILVCADLVPVNLRFLPQSKFVDKSLAEIKPTSANLEIMQDKSLGYRVFNSTVSPFNDATTSYFHRSVGGYHGAKMQRYQDIIDLHLSKMNWEVYNMLNTKYFITADKDSDQPMVELNPDANGAAWFVDVVTIVNSPQEEIEALDRLDTKHEAVVDLRFSEYLTTVNSADIDSLESRWIELAEYRANKLTYKYHSDREAIAIFSEIYYDKGWTAFIDGVEAPHFRANYILRGTVLPAGDHTVEFKFRASNYHSITAITLTSSLLIILSVIGLGVIAILRATKKEQADARK